MKLITIKHAKDSGIDGVKFVYTDKQITEIIVGKMHIRKGENYTKALEVLVEADFETVDRYELTGTIEGFPPAVSLHETKYDAECAGNKLEDAGAKIDIKLIQINIDDNGNVVARIESDIADSSDLPF